MPKVHFAETEHHDRASRTIDHCLGLRRSDNKSGLPKAQDPWNRNRKSLVPILKSST